MIKALAFGAMKYLGFIVSIVSLFCLSGCTKTEAGLAGGGIGTAVGAGIGYAIDGGAGGALAGGLMGAIVGAAAGSATCKEDESSYTEERVVEYRPSSTYRDDNLRQEIRREQYNVEQEKIDFQKQELEKQRLELEKKRLENEAKRLEKERVELEGKR